MLLKSCATNDIQKSTKHGELEDDCSTATAGISVRPCKYVLHSKKTFTKHQSPGRLVRVSSQSYSLAWPDPMGCRLSQNAYFSRRVAKSTCLLNINGIMMVSTHQNLRGILTNSQCLLNIASLSVLLLCLFLLATNNIMS